MNRLWTAAVRAVDRISPLRGRWLRYFMIVCGILIAGSALIEVGFRIGWIEEDPLYRAERVTREVLREYEWTTDTRKPLRGITDYHGEATGAQVMITLAEWSVGHPREFVMLTNELSPDQRQPFAESFSYGVSSGQTAAFLDAFGREESVVVTSILQTVTVDHGL